MHDATTQNARHRKNKNPLESEDMDIFRDYLAKYGTDFVKFSLMQGQPLDAFYKNHLAALGKNVRRTGEESKIVEISRLFRQDNKIKAVALLDGRSRVQTTTDLCMTDFRLPFLLKDLEFRMKEQLSCINDLYEKMYQEGLIESEFLESRDPQEIDENIDGYTRTIEVDGSPVYFVNKKEESSRAAEEKSFLDPRRADAPPERATRGVKRACLSEEKKECELEEESKAVKKEEELHRHSGLENTVNRPLKEQKTKSITPEALDPTILLKYEDFIESKDGIVADEEEIKNELLVKQKENAYAKSQSEDFVVKSQGQPVDLKSIKRRQVSRIQMSVPKENNEDQIIEKEKAHLNDVKEIDSQIGEDKSSNKNASKPIRFSVAHYLSRSRF